MRKNRRTKTKNNKCWYCPGCLEYPEPTQLCGWCGFPYCPDCLSICNECRVLFCPTCYQKHESYPSEDDEADETDIEEDKADERYDEADEREKDACEMPQEF